MTKMKADNTYMGAKVLIAIQVMIVLLLALLLVHQARLLRMAEDVYDTLSTANTIDRAIIQKQQALIATLQR